MGGNDDRGVRWITVGDLKSYLTAEDAEGFRRGHFRTASGPGSPSGQPAWGGGCDRIIKTTWKRTGGELFLGLARVRSRFRSLPLAVLKRPRSEERRVGKECRNRRAEKNKKE